MTKDAPAFDFYAERWTHGTRHMTKIERCDYIDLLCHQWTSDGLSPDLEIVARYLGYRKASQIPTLVIEKFPLAEDGKRRNKRLEIERVKQRERIEKRRKGAEKTNQKRWGNDVVCESLSDHLATPERFACESPPPTTHLSPQLLLDADAPAEVLSKPSKPKKESVADPRFTVFRDIFIQAYQDATGTPYAFQGGRDGKTLSQFLKTFKDVNEVAFLHAINWCRQVAASDQYAKGFVRQTGSLASFCSSWNQIVEYFQNYTPPAK